MDHSPQRELDERRAKVPALILAVVIAYGVALAMGLPQRGTQLVVEHQRHAAAAAETEESPALSPPPFWTVTPFVLLLAGIAVLPLIPQTAHWWESNWNRFKVAGGL